MKNYWLNVVMTLLALVLGTSAFLLWVVLPQGYFAARLLWLSIHKWTGLALSTAVILHFILHWKWVVRMTRRVLTDLVEQDLTGAQGRRDDPDRTGHVESARRSSS